MRKSYFAYAVLALAALASCQNNEFSDVTYTPGEGEFVFRVTDNAKLTKSSDADATVKGVTIPVGKIGQGSYAFDETITQLDEVAYGPETKGTPGYTKNFNDLYGGFNATVYRTGETTTYEEDGRFEIANTEGLIYKRKYPNDLWENGGLYFFLSAYYDGGSLAGVTNLTGHPEADDTYAAGDISFHYSSTGMTTAESQSDLLFTSRAVNTEAEYKKLINQNQGVPILFHHALTGIKFRVGNDNSSTTKTIITKVELLNIYDAGDCVISPRSEDNYTDNPTTYSSEKAVKWSNHGMTLGSFSQTYKGTNYSEGYSANEKDNTIDYSSDDNKFGASWYQNKGENDPNPSNMNNLNDEDGSLTFWLIPQVVRADAQLKITFYVTTPDTPDGTVITHTIEDFGAQLNGVEWKAGQLRTYTLKPLDVDVDIFDSMNQYVKSGLHVTNTGNVAEYVRMLVIGNWYGWETQAAKDANEEPVILVGYTSADPNNNTMVTPWTRWETQYGDFDDSFAGGELKEGRTDWVRASGGYYYTIPIGPGESLPNTSPLFDSYTLDEDAIPTIYVTSNQSSTRVPAVGVHLVMEVIVQAIGVPTKENGHNVWWKQAWYDATGIEKIKPTDAEVTAHAND